MKVTIVPCALALTALALPCSAQVSTPSVSSPQTRPTVAQQSGSTDLLQELRKLNLHRLSGSRYQYLSPQEKAQSDAWMATINRLDKAGTEALHLKNFAVAEASYRELVQMGTLGPFPYYGLGEALTGEGKTAEALAAYKTAVYWPLNRDPQAIALGQAMGITSNLRGCCGSSDAIEWMKCTLLLSQTGQNEEALSVYSEAVRHAPDTAHPEINRTFEGSLPSPVELQAAAHIALGLLVNDTGNDRELAMSEFAQAQKLAPEAAVTNFYYGYGWQRLDLQSKTRLADAPQARAALQKAALADDANVKKAASEALRRWR